MQIGKRQSLTGSCRLDLLQGLLLPMSTCDLQHQRCKYPTRLFRALHKDEYEIAERAGSSLMCQYTQVLSMLMWNRHRSPIDT